MPNFTPIGGPVLYGSAAAELINSPLRRYHGPVVSDQHYRSLPEPISIVLEDAFALTRWHCSCPSDHPYTDKNSVLTLLRRSRTNLLRLCPNTCPLVHIAGPGCEADGFRAHSQPGSKEEDVLGAAFTRPSMTFSQPEAEALSEPMTDAIRSAAVIHYRALALFIPWQDQSNHVLVSEVYAAIIKTNIHEWLQANLSDVLVWM